MFLTELIILRLNLDNVKLVELLVRNGANVTNDTTSMYWAILHGNVEMAELLLTTGSNPNARDKNNWTSLHHASDFGMFN